MTPNFALSLSFEGITLLRRMGARWARIEEVPLDHPDLDSAVSALRDRAEFLDPSGAQVALIIPNEQIRYLDQPDMGGDAATREVAIRAALDGATPYAVRELKFDHVVSGGRLMVAAVAHLTLEEARVFAIEHGFQPVCFLAQAPEGAFDGAVFFGKAKGWTRAVARPARPIEIVEADKAALTPLPPPEAAPAPVAETAPNPAPAARTPEAPAARPEPKTLAAPLPGADRALAAPSTARPAPPVTARPVAPAAARPAPPVSSAARPVQAPPIPPKVQPAPPPAADLPPEPKVTFSTRRAASGTAPAGDVPPVSAATAQLKPRFTPVPQADTAERPTAPSLDAAALRTPEPAPVRRPETPVVARREPPAPSPVPQAVPADDPAPRRRPGFLAKSAASDLLEQAAAAVDATERDTAPEPAKPRKLALPKRKAAPPKSPGPGRPLGKPVPRPVPPMADDAVPPPLAAVARRTQPGEKSAAGKPNPLARLAALRSAGGQAMPAGLATAGGPAMAIPATPGGKLFNTSTEREQMTVFGARARGPVGGKPRYLGLILTALLLLFLAGVAAWASVFLEDGLARLFRGNDRTETAVASLPDPADAPAAAADGVILESAAPVAPTAPPVPDAAEAADGPGVQLAAFDTTTEDAVAPLAVPVVPRALTSEEAAASYAASGVWQRAPVSPLTPPEDNVDDIYVASIDPDIQIFDAVALPDAARLEREPGFADPGLPPPAGLTFDFDERDLVRATPEGALTPDGLRIFTGRPPAVPPLRNSDDSRAPTTDAAPSVAVARPDTIPRIRPEARPSDVIEQRERVQLGGISRAELARIRPQMRPQTAQEQAQIAAPEATELAVDRSLIPVGRPRNMAAIVDQAEVSPDPVPVQTAAVAPRTVEPTLPSSASVARSATLNNAINLNKINLIGVYGTADNRRALVRLASGKYQKVKVGDSLDGGRVSAIGENELRYQKSGRDVVLQMPRT